MVVREGDPRVEIVNVADEMRAAMIVLGTRGLGRVKRFLIGSTCLAVARYASCPVAIVRGRPRKTGRVIVAIDGSSGSRAALRFLSIVGLKDDSRVIVMHVVPDAAGGGASRSRRADAQTLVQDGVARLQGSRRSVDRLITQGDAAREIVKAARIRDVDLVVVGARGLRTLGRLLLGSVSETVLHRADRPVIIVRERHDRVR